jgi:TDG/mug DNA glycosylase family protein
MIRARRLGWLSHGVSVRDSRIQSVNRFEGFSERTRVSVPRSSRTSKMARRARATPTKATSTGTSARARKPTNEELRSALRNTVRDVIAPDLKVLFCGINPGRYSAAVGHHFAGPSNRFWKTLHAAGFTPRLLTPFEDEALLALRLGITNLVDRATVNAALLSSRELREGAERLTRKVRRFRPRVLAVVGLGAYRDAFGEADADCGLQWRQIGSTRIWLLPNPSGLNAHHQGPALVTLFRQLYVFVVADRSV